MYRSGIDRHQSAFVSVQKWRIDQLIGFLAEYFEIAGKVVQVHEGIIDKFIGDGVMALFGALSNRKASERAGALLAVKAARAFRSEFAALLRRWQESQWSKRAREIEIGLGCGIHTGPVLVGIVKTTHRDQFSAFGDNVNLAARFEKEAAAGQILISRSTQTCIKGDIPSREVGMVQVKNIEGKYRLFEIIDA